jgi:hypothetical protein
MCFENELQQHVETHRSRRQSGMYRVASAFSHRSYVLLADSLAK